MNVICILGRQDSPFTDEEIDSMRRKLAKRWNQTISQVTDYEAIHYLREAAR